MRTRHQSNAFLPLGLILFCIDAVLLLTGPGVQAKQQKCRLQPRNNQAILSPPANTGIGTSNSNNTKTSSLIATSSASSTQTGHAPTVTNIPTSSSSSLPSPTPFNYGTDKIRGVNLYEVSGLLCACHCLSLLLSVGEDGSY